MINTQSHTKNLYFSPKLSDKLLALGKYPLTIVEAPMGYGKTTAVRHFLKDTTAQVLWLKIFDDSTDNFWDSFARLFDQLENDLYRRLAHLGLPDDAVSQREILRLLSGLNFSDQCLLVLDDYHLLNSPEIDHFLTALIENEIKNLQIVVITRYSSFEKMEELSLKGLLYHLGKEAFELDPPDILNYYRECRVIISSDQAQKLYAITEGWISALYLMLLSYLEDGLLKPSNSIYKLIEKTVYLPLSEKEQAFITQLSIFDRFTIWQAEFIWGSPDAAALMATIFQKNAFITYDYPSKSYQIHSLFKTYLRETLENQGLSKALLQKAAAWYLEQKDYSMARQFFYAGDDFEAILNSIETEKARLFTRQNMRTLGLYLDECPAEIKSRHHYALLILCIHFILHNEFQAFSKTFQEVAVNIGADKSLSENQRNSLYGEFELLYGISCFNDLKEMSTHFERSRHLLSGSTAIFDVESDWTHGSPSVLYLYYRESGKLSETLKVLKDGLPCYQSLTGGHSSGGDDLLEAEWSYYQGDFLEAEIALTKALHQARQFDQWGIELGARFLQLRIDWMKGDFDHIFHLLSLMRQDMASCADYHYLHNMELCEMFFYALCDQKYKIPEGLARPESGEIRLLHASFGMFNIIYGRILLINEAYTELLGSEDYFLNTAGFYPNLLGGIYTHLYAAAANLKVGRLEKALESLKKAMDLALPDKLYMAFVENSDYLSPLLEALADQGHYLEEIKTILDLSKTYTRAKEKIREGYFSNDSQALTDRENEIARMAASGMTNKEIAEALFVSANTVKSALKSVYSKLSINSRRLLRQYFESADLQKEN